MKEIDFQDVRFLFTDVDDTLTTGGRLLPDTYQALWDLATAGIAIIPVTGGCAGWCDQIARTWPVAGVIGESGGFYVLREADNRTTWHYWFDRDRHRRDQIEILHAIDELVLPFPVALAKDQSFRQVDVAIDYNQDVRLSTDQAARIGHDLTARGFNVKQSSIHINVWRGDFNKGAMAQRMLANVFGLNEREMKQQTVFIGDAPNDENMFEFFPKSVGVANIRKHLPHMRHHPAVIAGGASGHGVRELIEHWLPHLSLPSAGGR